MAVGPEFGPRDGPIAGSTYQDFYIWEDATGTIVTVGRSNYEQIPLQQPAAGHTVTPGRCDYRIHAVDLADPPNLIEITPLALSIDDDDGFAPHATKITANRSGRVSIMADGEVLAQYEATAGAEVGVTFHWGVPGGTEYQVTISGVSDFGSKSVNVVAPFDYVEASDDDINVPMPRGLIEFWREEARGQLLQLLVLTPDTLDEIKVSFRELLKLTIAEEFLAQILSVAPEMRPIRDRRP